MEGIWQSMQRMIGEGTSHPWIKSAKSWLSSHLLRLKEQVPIISTVEPSPSPLGEDIASLPQTLGFVEQDAPGLVAAHERLKSAINRHDIASAESVAESYKELAEVILHNRQLRSEEDRRRYSRLHGGMLIQLAYNWSKYGAKNRAVKSAYLNALNEAMAYCREHGWLSLVTLLASEKQKVLMPQPY